MGEGFGKEYPRWEKEPWQRMGGMRAYRTLETYSVFQEPRNGGPVVRHELKEMLN